MQKKISIIFFVTIWLIAFNFGNWGKGMVIVAYPGSNGIFYLGITALELIVFLILLKHLKINMPNKLIIFLILFNLFIISFLRPNIFLSLKNFIAIFFSFGIVLFSVSLLHSLELKKAFSIFTMTITTITFACVLLHLYRGGSTPLIHLNHNDFSSRLGGAFPAANTAMLCGMNMLLSLIGATISRTKKEKYTYFLLSALMLLFVIFTDCRSVLIPTILCAFLIIFPSYKNINWHIKNILIHLFLLINSLVLFYFINYKFNNDLTEKLMNDFLYRLEIWKLAITGILKKPWIGYGNENFLKSDISTGLFERTIQDPHSAFLSLALHSGIVSLILFIIFYAVIIRNYWKYSCARPRLIINIAIFWCVVPAFWGHSYNFSGGIIQIVFPISIIGFLLHPGNYEITK
ncbi:MAG: O-antigen ligase family protein [Candidatus Omnitrophica bacterium]|nr:O-antigen ligase family protein [Candidatus Omnitrophota bacterium]